MFYAHHLISLCPCKVLVRHIERRLLRTVHAESCEKRLGKLLKSKKALAIPVTYLILFASLMAIISVTYSFAIVKISARSSLLKASVAKQNMQFLDDAIRSVAWSSGASEVIYMDDCGGEFKTGPTAKNLVLNLTDEQSFYDLVFNSSVGRVYYQLEASEFNEDGLFVKGDDRAIINQTAFTVAQLNVGTEGSAKEIILCYRPLATAAVIGTSNGKPLNFIRVYVLNLNSSESLMIQGKFYLKATSVNVASTESQYEFNRSISSLALKATSDGKQTAVILPISSVAEGAVVSLEVLVSNISIQRVEV